MSFEGDDEAFDTLLKTKPRGPIIVRIVHESHGAVLGVVREDLRFGAVLTTRMKGANPSSDEARYFRQMEGRRLKTDIRGHFPLEDPEPLTELDDILWLVCSMHGKIEIEFGRIWGAVLDSRRTGVRQTLKA